MTRQASALHRLSPRAAADAVAALGDDGWTRQFLSELQAQVHSDSLARVMSAWGLSSAATARVFGVTRQAVGKWRAQGVPEDRLVALADLAAATDVLSRYVRSDRIPAVVRRPADVLGGRSLLQLAEEHRYDEVRRGVAHMLDLRRVAP